uniref:Protein FAM192A-like n=1 Tax=Phallusia mammillata TaxID=59560 RepID=A0A6F9DCZ8_9ASCI|nr:protein FAM192A-like [Phallusia mammillata]
MNKFVSESEIAEKRRLRQEEWEKVRKAEDPVEAPEEVYDPRSLFDRLQEQKDKKQNEFEESIKFKNQFRGIDKTEADFLDMVSTQASLIEKQKKDEEKKELEEFRAAVRTVKKVEPNDNSDKMPKTESFVKKSTNKQLKLLQSGIKRKSTPLPEKNAKRTTNEKQTDNRNVTPVSNIGTDNEKKETTPTPPGKSNALLPGLSCYGSDGDSTNSEEELDDNKT